MYLPCLSQSLKNKSKSSHDLLDDAHLSTVPAVEALAGDAPAPDQAGENKRKDISESDVCTQYFIHYRVNDRYNYMTYTQIC